MAKGSKTKAKATPEKAAAPPSKALRAAHDKLSTNRRRARSEKEDSSEELDELASTAPPTKKKKKVAPEVVPRVLIPRAARELAKKNAVWLDPNQLKKRSQTSVPSTAVDSEPGLEETMPPKKKKTPSKTAGAVLRTGEDLNESASAKPAVRRHLPAPISSESEEDVVAITKAKSSSKANLSLADDIGLFDHDDGVEVYSASDRNLGDYGEIEDDDGEEFSEAEDDDLREERIKFERPKLATTDATRYRSRAHAPPIDDELESSHSASPTRFSSKPKVGSSRHPSDKAIKKAQYETPRFPSPPSSDEDIKPPPTSSGHSELSTDGDSSEIEMVDGRDKGWPSRTHLSYTARFGIREQQGSVKAVLHDGIQNVFEDMFWGNPFPVGEVKMRCIRNALFKAAEDLEDTEIADRLSKDKAYCKILSTVVDGRMSKFRGDISKAVATAVSASFSLTSTTVIDTALTLDHYVYRRIVGTQNPDLLYPFRHPVIETVLKAMFFDRRNGLATHCRHKFTSSLPGHEIAKHELEVQPQMIAMIATAMYAAIKGAGRPAAKEFSADANNDVYIRHVAVLAQIRNDKPEAYHAITGSLYKHCIGAAVNMSTAPPVIDCDHLPTTLE